MRRFNLFAPSFDQSSDRDVAAAVGAEQIAARLYELEDGERSHAYHFHHGIEEWLIVVAGSPVVRTPAGERALGAGDVVCFAAGPGGGHQVTGPGTILLVSDRRAVDAVEFPDSGTIGIYPPGKLFRSADAVESPGGA